MRTLRSLNVLIIAAMLLPLLGFRAAPASASAQHDVPEVLAASSPVHGATSNVVQSSAGQLAPGVGPDTFGVGPWAVTTGLPQPVGTPFGGAGRQLTIYNGRVYIFGGKNGTEDRLTSVYYSNVNPDGSLGAWNATTPLPAQYFDQAVVRVGAYVYLISGANSDTAVYYAPINSDGSVGAWTATLPLLPSRQNFAAASYGTTIYVSGGNSGGTRDFVKFTSVKSDGSLNPWADTTPLPEPMEGHAMAAYNGYLYVVDFYGKVYYASINSNGTLGAWAATTPTPVPTGGTAFAYAWGLYLLGGGTQAVYYAPITNNGSLGAWQTTTPLPEPRGRVLAGAQDGLMYVAGGFDGASYRNSVFYAKANSIPNPAQYLYDIKEWVSPFYYTFNASETRQTKSGAVGGAELGEKEQGTWNVYCGGSNIYIATRRVWVGGHISYGVTYKNVPTPSVTSSRNQSGQEIYNLSSAGADARTWLYKRFYYIDGSWAGDWMCGSPSDVTFTWSVTGIRDLAWSVSNSASVTVGQADLAVNTGPTPIGSPTYTFSVSSGGQTCNGNSSTVIDRCNAVRVWLSGTTLMARNVAVSSGNGTAGDYIKLTDGTKRLATLAPPTGSLATTYRLSGRVDNVPYSADLVKPGTATLFVNGITFWISGISGDRVLYAKVDVPQMQSLADFALLEGRNYRNGFHEISTSLVYSYTQAMDAAGQDENSGSLKRLKEAEKWYRRVLAFDPSNPQALEGLLNTHWEQSTIGLLKGNDAFVQALAVRQELAGSESQLLDAAIAHFDAAVAPWRELLADPRVGPYLRAVEAGRTDSLGITPYPDYRRLALAAARRSRAYFEKGRYLFNRDDRSGAEAAFRLGLAAARADAALLAALWPGASDNPDYRQLLVQSAEMERLFAYLAADLNPYGYGPGFVPFWYDPRDEPRNNYEQIYDYLTAGGNTPIDVARSSEQAALTSERAFDDYYDRTAARLNDLKVQYNTQLITLCGQVGGEPDLEHCVTNPAGQTYDQMQSVDIAEKRVREKQYAMEKIMAQIGIEEERAGQMCGIYRANAELITSTGVKLSDLAREEARVKQRMNEMDAFDIGLKVVTGIVSIAATVASGGAAAPLVFGLAAGLMGDVKKNGQQNQAIGDLGDIEARREELRAYESAQLQLSQCDLVNADTKARIKSLFLEMPSLDIEMSIAQQALLQEAGRLQALLQRKDLLVRQRDEAWAFTISLSLFQDPGYRVERDYYTIMAKDALEYGKELTYKLGRAMECEINYPAPLLQTACGHPLQTLNDIYGIRDVSTLEAAICQIDATYQDFRTQRLPIPQLRETKIYLSRALGFDDYYDPYLGHTVTREEQFNQWVRDPAQRDNKVNLVLKFSTSVAQGNPFFSSGMFNDKIKYMQARVYGTNLGDAQAVIYLTQAGTSFIRTVDAYPRGDLTKDDLRDYDIESKKATLTAATNLNELPPAVALNKELATRSVAFTSWKLVIDKQQEPDNFDVNLDGIEEIELTVGHENYSIQSVGLSGMKAAGVQDPLEPLPLRPYRPIGTSPATPIEAPAPR